MKQCIFCHRDTSSSKSVEHIIPESLGNKHHFLPRGYVCDKCNNYFSIKIESVLLAQPYFTSMRFRNEILSKKGRLVKEKMNFPGELRSSEVVFRTTENELVFSLNDEEVYESIKAGRINTIVGPYIPEPEFPNVIMSRFLAKCAYEFFLYNMGIDKYDSCVQELLGSNNDILKDLREYARYGRGKYWQYYQHRLYSEGRCVLNEKENNYSEILHEMRFFIKEHKNLPNGFVQAEIYFILVIAGIEFVICISNPDISEYLKWVEEHNGISHLTDEAETESFSLSDVNPMLIKKNIYN